MRPGPKVPDPSDCPRCGAPKEKRVDAHAFGPKRETVLCGVCGHEWPEPEDA